MTDSILLKLGDVIKIYSPSNELLDNNIFLIEYIDERKIKITDVDNYQERVISLTDTKVLDEIDKIEVLSRNKKEGYALQHDLVPNTWVNIYFQGDVPLVVTGQISDLQNDIIEVKLYETKELIYINFEYKGLVEDLSIEDIEIREAPIVEEEVEVEEKKKEKKEEKEEKGKVRVRVRQ